MAQIGANSGAGAVASVALVTFAGVVAEVNSIAAGFFHSATTASLVEKPVPTNLVTVFGHPVCARSPLSVSPTL